MLPDSGQNFAEMSEPHCGVPTVSVIIPTYNHKNFVLETIQSALDQNGVNFEVIVVNDGSPDQTAEILRPLIESGSIKYIAQPNAGQAAARNCGITAATGEFLALLDDDDLWPINHLAWAVAMLERQADAVMVYGYFEKFGEVIEQDIPDEPGGLRTFADFARRCLLVSPGQALFRREALLKVGGLDATLRGTDDWDLYLRLAGVGTIYYENRCALQYRVHAANASKNFWQMYVNGRRVVEKNLPPGSADPTLRRAAMQFAREYGSYMGINQVIALRREKRFAAMIWALMKTVWIRPALLSPSEIRRRSRYVIGPRNEVDHA